jgi:hypothetical protein
MKFEFEVKEAELVLNALVQLPYAQVAGLVSKIQQQAQGQLVEEQSTQAQDVEAVDA